MKALLLENISGVAEARLAAAGFAVETATGALSGDLLKQKLRGVSDVPGMLLAVNEVLAKKGINIERQVLDTRGEIGYAIYDINRGCDEGLIHELQRIPHTIRVRASRGSSKR